MIPDTDAYFIFEGQWGRDDLQQKIIFKDPITSIVLNSPSEVPEFFNKIASAAATYFLAGFFSYEAGYAFEKKLQRHIPDNKIPLAVFYVFDKADISSLPENDIAGVRRCCIEDLQLNLSEDEYISAVRSVKKNIKAGDIYQLNYTMKQRFSIKGSAFDLYETLKKQQGAGFNVYCELGAYKVLSLSPELFFERCKSSMRVKPMKGTSSRGLTEIQDIRQVKYLKNDQKNRSENIMIVDLLRNDLARVSDCGSVKVGSLFDVEKYNTLFQMTSTVKSELLNAIDMESLFTSIFPSGSVTGAPKIRSMELIRSYEKEARGIYTGSIGFFMPGDFSKFNVAIRTIVIDESGNAEMGLGSGIVFDSDPAGEYRECKLKSEFIRSYAPDFSLIETMLYEKGEINDLAMHLARIRSSAAYFNFIYDEENIVESLEMQKRELDNTEYKLRLILKKNGRIEIDVTTVTAEAGVLKLAFSDIPVDSRDKFLYHKTTNREFYNSQRDKALSEGLFDLVFMNQDGEVTESSICNIYIKKDGVIYTPPSSSGLLDGIIRRKKITGKEVLEKKIEKKDIIEADNIYVSNSIIGFKEASLQI